MSNDKEKKQALYEHLIYENCRRKIMQGKKLTGNEQAIYDKITALVNKGLDNETGLFY